MGDLHRVGRTAGIAMKPFWKAARTAAALSALFLVVYGGCNWVTSRRAQVPSFYFAWERHIPFVPAMILPYMSIDLFFVAAPFVVRSDRQRRTLAARIAAAILIAGACFLLFPLRFAFERPQVNGPLGLIFNNFRSLDLPFNEFPSLHIALCAILFDTYDRNLKGQLRRAVAFWFIMIALSPLLTYQHHVIDILGGFALAILCFHFFRDEPLLQRFTPNRRVGIYHAAGAVLLTGLAMVFMPWSGVLLWPALSTAFIAAGYFVLGPGIYRKENGRHPWTTRLLLGPVLLGQRLSLMYYARRCQAYDRLTDRLLIGRRLSDAEARAAGVTAVVDLTAEFSEAATFRHLPYLQLPILDLTAPTPDQFDEAIAFIEGHAGAGTVYLHCKAGYSRTATVAGAYLLTSGSAETVEQALAELRRARPSVIVRPEALKALHDFQARRCADSPVPAH